MKRCDYGFCENRVEDPDIHHGGLFYCDWECLSKDIQWREAQKTLKEAVDFMQRAVEEFEEAVARVYSSD
jgi:hypothetical protein